MFGLHPDDAFEAARHEAIMAAVEDVRAEVNPTLRMSDEAAKKAAREALAAGYLPTWGERMARQIERGPLLAGERLSVADLELFVLMRWFDKGAVDHVPNDVLSRIPTLGAHYAAVAGHEAVSGYYAAHSQN